MQLMTELSTKTVPQLKDLLRAQGLSTSGVKADLIARLQAAGVDSRAAADTPVESQPAAETTAETVAETTSAAPAETSGETSGETTNETTSAAPAPASAPSPAPAAKPLGMTAEQRKAAALELLNKNLHRAKKFGSSETDIENIKRDIARVEKFGVDASTSLAKLIGFENSSLGDGKKKHKRK